MQATEGLSRILSTPSPTAIHGEAVENLVAVFGYILSSMAIAVHLFIHFTTDIFRNLPGNLLMTNCLLLFLQYCFSTVYLTLDSEHANWSPETKSQLRLYDYYFTAYIWSVLTRVQFAMAFDLWRCLKTQTTNIRFSRQYVKLFAKYMLICWLSPFLELGLLWVVKRFTVARRMDDCFICFHDTMQQTLLIFFISDMIIMVSNFLFYLCCLYYIYQTKSSVKSANRHGSNFVFYFKICGRLFIMSEVNYTLLILVYHFDVGGLKQIFQYFMAYHGFIVFVVIVLQKTLLKQRASGRTDSERTGTTGTANVTMTSETTIYNQPWNVLQKFFV